MLIDHRSWADLFFDPKNVGEARHPNVTGRSASFQCGATLQVSLHIDDSQRIVDAKFKAAGCSAMVAAASLLTERVLGKPTGEAAALAQQSGWIQEWLEPVDPARVECLELVSVALVER